MNKLVVKREWESLTADQRSGFVVVWIGTIVMIVGVIMTGIMHLLFFTIFVFGIGYTIEGYSYFLRDRWSG